jgi:nucleotide-binding universal stress UspA family protein
MVPQIKKILYATDLTKNSAYAFYYAIDLAQRRDAKIVILHVVEPLPPIVKFYGSLEGEKKYYQQEKAADLNLIRKRLQDICKKVDSKTGTSCLMLVSNIIVPEGNPVEEILRAAEEEACDLLILGSHGKGFLKQTFLGSVSHKVLDRSRKPVLIIPLPSEKIAFDWDEIA